MQHRKKVPTRCSKRVLISEEPEMIPRPEHKIWNDPEQEARFKILMDLHVYPSRFAHDITMADFNMKEDVSILFGQIGLTHFIQQWWPTYSDLTLEFLATFKGINLEGKEHTTPKIKFQLYNRSFELSLVEFNNIFHFPNDGHMKIEGDFNPTDFWRRITGEDRLIYKLAKASSIQNPIFRYVHRILSNTIFGRGDNDGAVSEGELFFLHCMTSCTPVNVGAFLARQFQRRSHKKKGSIAIGGLITPIAQHLHLELDDIDQVEGTSFLNTRTVHSMGLAKKMRGFGNVFVFKDRTETIPCKDRDRFTPTNSDNWLFFDPPASAAGPPPTMPPCQPNGPSVSEPPTNMVVDPPPYHQATTSFDFAAMQSTLASIYAEQLLQAGQLNDIRVEQLRQAVDINDLRARQERIEAIVRRMHDYHFSQGHYGIILPPPRPSPSSTD